MGPSAMALPAPPQGAAREPVAKISEVIATYRPTKIFRPKKPDTSTTSLDFDDSGELLLTAGDDEALQIYSCKEGKHVKTLFSKKYGAHLARFTHHSSSVLYSSTKGDPVIRYLSTHDNQFIRYFPGHTSTVTSLNLSPASDLFVSTSTDSTVKLWSLSSPNPSGSLTLTTPTLSAFDPSASVLAIASPSTSLLLLYDLRHYDKAPFATFDLLAHEATYLPTSPAASRPEWTKLEFANDGASILIATAGAGHFILDAFSGELKVFCSRKPPPPQSARLTPGQARLGVLGQGDVCFSPDGRYLIGANGTEHLYAWDTQRKPENPDHRVLPPTHELENKGKMASLVAFNPRFNLCVSADQEIVLWTPDMEAMTD